MKTGSGIGRIAFVGNYLPRKCGIATFTHDLCEAVAEAYPETPCFALPVTDHGQRYDYPERVRFQIAERDIRAYEQAADYLNILDLDVVSLQHEFGLFGGRDGRHIFKLLRRLRMPAVTTMHTVLKEPSESVADATIQLAELSSRIVVMAELGRDFLTGIYGVDPAKIDVIPHGIPDVPFVDPNYFKEQCGVVGRITLLTFGLLGPNKGIEYAIRALPAIVEQHPEVVYVVLGATHPNLVREQGEAYRIELQRLAESLGVGGHVVFHNRFVSLTELKEFIGASDIYITPYLNEAQITSGTLSYAFGAGKAVVSTPYWHARELLRDGDGMLVPFLDADAIARAVLHLIEDEEDRHRMRRSAYRKSRDMVWSKVAGKYHDSFARARSEHASSALPAPGMGLVVPRLSVRLPDTDLTHIRRLTDSVGIWQHGRFTVPAYREGYCLDDNARALLLTVLLTETGDHSPDEVEDLATAYLAFINYAFRPHRRRFRNFLAFDRRWKERIGSEDSHGRALWALGCYVGHSERNAIKTVAAQLVMDALPVVPEFTSPRAWAFTLLGVTGYLKRFPGDVAVEHIRDQLIDKLEASLASARKSDWPWFENGLTYVNAKLPHALLVAANCAGRDELIGEALNSLKWLMTVQTGESGCFSPIGSGGWYPQDGERTRFDQQPIEAHASVSACLAAHRITGDEEWYLEARRAFDWFLGENDLGVAVYDPTTGGCRDALHVDRPNQNQGAESTLAFHLALCELRLAHHDEPVVPAPMVPAARTNLESAVDA